MIDFYMKKGDLLPVLRMELQDSNNTIINLSGCTVDFNYRLRPTGSVVSRQTTIYDAASGLLEYYWVSGDTSSAGLYNGEFVVTFDDSSQMTFPVRGPFVFEIVDDIS